jgi:hypothetical protein
MSGMYDQGDGREDGPGSGSGDGSGAGGKDGGGAHRYGGPPHRVPYRDRNEGTDYGFHLLRTLDRPVRLTLYRLLAVPLAVGLVLAVQPWDWGGSSHSGATAFESGQFPGASDNAADGDSGLTDQGVPETTDPQPGDPDPTDGSTDTGATGTETDTPSPSATEDPASQADALDNLISQSAASRGQVSSAVADAESCGSLSSDAGTLQSAADTRSDLSQQAGALTMDAVDGGSQAASLLSTALSLSATADTDYADWATALAGGTCSQGTTHDQSAYKNGGTDSAKAQKAKADFIAVWNPIATQYDLPTRTADEF